MSTRDNFWKEMIQHWKAVGRGYQADKEVGVMRVIAKEWFGKIKHYGFSDEATSELFRRFRSQYSTTNSLTSLKCFIDVSTAFNAELKQKARQLASPRPNETPEDAGDPRVGRILASFVTTWLKIIRSRPELKNKTEDECYREMMKEAFKWAVETKRPQDELTAMMKRMKAKGIEIPEP